TAAGKDIQVFPESVGSSRCPSGGIRIAVGQVANIYVCKNGENKTRTRTLLPPRQHPADKTTPGTTTRPVPPREPLPPRKQGVIQRPGSDNTTDDYDEESSLGTFLTDEEKQFNADMQTLARLFKSYGNKQTATK